MSNRNIGLEPGGWGKPRHARHGHALSSSAPVSELGVTTMARRAAGRPCGPWRSSVQTSAMTCSVFLQGKGKTLALRYVQSGMHKWHLHANSFEVVTERVQGFRMPCGWASFVSQTHAHDKLHNVTHPKPIASARMAPQWPWLRCPWTDWYRNSTPSRWCGRRWRQMNLQHACSHPQTESGKLTHEWQCKEHDAHGSTTTAVIPAVPERHCVAFSTSASGASASCSGATFGAAAPGAVLPGMLTPAGCPGFLKPAGHSAVLRTVPAVAGPALRRKHVPDLIRAPALMSCAPQHNVMQANACSPSRT